MPKPDSAEDIAAVAAAIASADAIPPVETPLAVVQLAPPPAAVEPPAPVVEAPLPPPTAPVVVEPPAPSAATLEIDRISSQRFEEIRAKQAKRAAPPAPPPPPSITDVITPAPAPAVDLLDIDRIVAEARDRGIDPAEHALALLEKVQKLRAGKDVPARKFEKPAALSRIDELTKKLDEERKAREDLEQRLGAAGSEYQAQQTREAEQRRNATIMTSAGLAFHGTGKDVEETRKAYPMLAKKDAAWIGRATLSAVNTRLAANEKRAEQDLPPLPLTTEEIFVGLNAKADAEYKQILKELGIDPAASVAPAVAVASPLPPPAAPKPTGAVPLLSPTQTGLQVPRGYEGIKLRPGETQQDLQDAIAAIASAESAA